MLIIGGVDIGNRLDIGPRMVTAIQSSDILLVENKSMFERLCSDLSISPNGTVVEYFAPMDEEKENQIISGVMSALENKKTVLICPDDGMAGVADPGGKVVSIAHSRQFPVEVIPGPSIVSALPAALAMGGKSFIFDDDIPGPMRFDRIKRFRWAIESKTPYLFLVKNRRDDNSKLAEVLDDIMSVSGPHRQVGIGINVTMPNQMILRDTISNMIERIKSIEINQSHFISVLIEGQYE